EHPEAQRSANSVSNPKGQASWQSMTNDTKNQRSYKRCPAKCSNYQAKGEGTIKIDLMYAGPTTEDQAASSRLVIMTVPMMAPMSTSRWIKCTPSHKVARYRRSPVAL